MIFGNNFITRSQKNIEKVSSKKYETIKLVNDFTIECHYTGENDALIWEYVKLHQNPVIALPDGTAVLYHERGLNIIGKKAAYIFDGNIKKDLCPGAV